MYVLLKILYFFKKIDKSEDVFRGCNEKLPDDDQECIPIEALTSSRDLAITSDVI